MINEEEYQKQVEDSIAELVGDESYDSFGDHEDYYWKAIQWCRQNPPPEVMTLVEALEVISKYKISGKVANVTNSKPSFEALDAIEALAAFEKKQKENL